MKNIEKSAEDSSLRNSLVARMTDQVGREFLNLLARSATHVQAAESVANSKEGQSVPPQQTKK